MCNIDGWRAFRGSRRRYLLALARLGVPALALGNLRTAAAQDAFCRVPVLAYHSIGYGGTAYEITPELLATECQWLVDNGYSPISLWQFWDAATGMGKLPSNPVLLTNDDGWPSCVNFADTVVGRFGLPATFFINNVSPISADQIVTMAQYGPVQAHTATHRDLASLDYDSQLSEVADNKAYLEQITGQAVNFLAWPNGSSNASAVQAATAAGVAGAFGLHGVAADITALDTFYIPRIMMEAADDLNTVAVKVRGW
jgi:peptidoglycan/xylan/chitin deacetylase (PgdA/CDA1 family)